MVDLWGWICWKSRGEQWHNLGNLLQGHLRSISQVAACWLSVKKKSSWDRKWGTEKEREIFVEFSSILGLSPIRTVWSSQLRNSCGALRWHWNQLTKILDASSAPKSRLKPQGFWVFCQGFRRCWFRALPNEYSRFCTLGIGTWIHPQAAKMFVRFLGPQARWYVHCWYGGRC